MKILNKVISSVAALALFFAPLEANAALATGTVWQIQATATTGNTGGAGFNTANANFPTDLTATSGTGNSPVLSSATYNFVAGDVGAWVYIKSGTNWTPGWYKIASVASNNATVNATIGSAIQITNSIYGTNTVAGVATVASPTAGTYGVDYSQQDTANSTITDAVSVGSSTTLTSATAPWTPVSVGNIFHLTTTGTGAFGVTGWYEIVSYTSAGQVTTDRTTNNGTALAAGTGQTGGAGRLNGLENAFQLMLPASSIVWVKNGSYTFSGALSAGSTNCTAILACSIVGFNVTRGDTPTGVNRPVFTLGANVASFSQFQNLYNIIFTGTANAELTVTGGGEILDNIKVTNTSTSAQTAVDLLGLTQIIDSEIVSQNGPAIFASVAGTALYGNYIHDSQKGFTDNTFISSGPFVGNIFASNTVSSVNTGGTSNGNYKFINNLFYGREAKIGTGILLGTANQSGTVTIDNIFYGLTTGISVATGSSGTNIDIANDYYNNTTDNTNWVKGPTSIAVNPVFAGASQLTGTTATSSGSVLTDSGASFGVTDNVDYLHVTSGTGATAGGYLITSHTGTTLTVNNAIGTSNAGNLIYWVSHGTNFGIGSNLVAKGFPTFMNSGSLTSSYPDIGPVVPQVPAAGGAWTF